MAWRIFQRIRKLFRVTVLDDVWPEMLFFTLVATAVSVISDKTRWHLGISNALLTVLGNAVVLQTLLSFRTATATERYYEGRALWSSLSSSCRTIARAIWIYSPNTKGENKEEGFEMETLIEKKSMINLLYALAISVKHFIRDEKGIDYEDLYHLVCWLPAYSNISPDHPYWYKLDFQSPINGTLISGVTTMKSSPPSSIKSEDHNVKEGSSSNQDRGTDSENDALPAGDVTRLSGSSNESPFRPRGDDRDIENFLENDERCTSPETIARPTPKRLKSFHLRRNITLPGPNSTRTPYQPLSSDESDADNQILNNPKSKSPRAHQAQFSEAETLVGNPEYENSTRREESFDTLRNSYDLEQRQGSPRTTPLKPASEAPRNALRDVFPLWRFVAFVGRKVRRASTFNDYHELDDVSIKRKRNPYSMVESSVPLNICMTLSSYLCCLYNEKRWPPAIESNVLTCMINLQDIISNLERVTNGPLPFAYETHIRMSLWIYLFFLPFQIYDTFGYVTIAVTAFTTFLFVGFLEIGRELENPFDYDPNDINLDDICGQLRRELEEITAQIHSESLDSMIYASNNHPFAPADQRSADLLRDGQIDSIETTMLRCWVEVNEVTREWKTD